LDPKYPSGANLFGVHGSLSLAFHRGLLWYCVI